jgi:hypothetical protein
MKIAALQMVSAPDLATNLATADGLIDQAVALIASGNCGSKSADPRVIQWLQVRMLGSAVDAPLELR